MTTGRTTPGWLDAFPLYPSQSVESLCLVLIAFFTGIAFGSETLTKFLTALVGFASLLTALFIAVQVAREVQRKQERETAAVAQASTIAFALRRQAQAWTTGTGSPMELVVWWKNRERRWRDLSAAEARCGQLSSLIPHLPPPKVVAVHLAIALLYEVINWTSDADEPTIEYEDAHQPLYLANEVVHALDEHLTTALIDPGMAREAKRARRSFQNQHPLPPEFGED